MFEAKNVFVGALLILRRFTLFNIKFYAETEDSDYIFGIFLLPLLGLIIGLGSLAISIFKFIYEPMFIGILIFIYYCIITKSNNLIATYKTIHTIIRPKNGNEQVFETLALVIICMLYFTLFSLLSIRAVLLAPVVGFSNLLILSLLIKRDKKDTDILKYCTRNHAIFAFVFSFVITIIISYKLTVALSLTYIITGILMNYFDSKIKILPSSIEGLIVEVSQILFLILSYILFLYK